MRTALESELKTLVGCSSHHLQGSEYIVVAAPQAAQLVNMPRPPIGWRHNALMAVVCLSVCLSVRLSACPVLDPKSRIGGNSNLKIGSKESHVTGDP